MMKDIPNRKVENIAIAILPPEGGDVNSELWDVYLLNLRADEIKGVMVSTKGYGERNNEKVQTGTFRYFVEHLSGLSAVIVEPIQSELFDIVHEFFVSFSADNHLYDKKYIFVKGSLDEANFTTIPILDRKGVMIK